MCGRYTFYGSEEVLKSYNLGATEDFQLALNLPDNFNVAPGSHMPVIVRGSQENAVQLMLWGLVPSWSKTASPDLKLINARQEGLLEKPMWRSLIKSKRCIIPANGFYEWQRQENLKQPFYMTPKSGGVFSFAGLYDDWHDSQGNYITSYCIITTSPNADMKPIHNRMPAILDRDQQEIWLSGDTLDANQLAKLLSPAPDGTLLVTKVKPDVNNARNNFKELIYELE